MKWKCNDMYRPKIKNPVFIFIYSDASGNCSFWHLAPGTHSVTPSDAYSGTCIPEAAVTITGSDVTATDFVKQF